MRLEAKRFQIRNLLGIQDCTVEPGKVTIVEGPNGAGKTSLLESVKLHFGRGHDATLLRHGCTEGESVLVLNDGHSLRTRVTADDTDRQVRHRDIKGKLPRARAVIDSLGDSISINPSVFLDSATRPETRATLILEAMPVEISTEQIALALGVAECSVAGDDDVHALVRIARLRKSLEDFRAVAGAEAKKAKAIAEGIQVPEFSDIDWRAESIKRAAAVAAADRQRMEQVSATREGFLKAKARAEKTFSDGTSEAERQRDAAIAAIHYAFASGLEARSKIRRDSICEAEQRRDKYLETIAADAEPEIRRLGDLAAEAMQRASDSAVISSNRTLKQAMEVQAEAHQAEWVRLHGILAKLKSFEQSLLESLPIPGLQVIDGRLYFDEIPFERLNTQKKIDIIAEWAKLRAKKFGFVVIDNLECLDQEHFDAFVRQALESDVQWVLGRVSEGSLRVTTLDESGVSHETELEPQEVA